MAFPRGNAPEYNIKLSGYPCFGERRDLDAMGVPDLK
jgi:hypothetical protein